MGLQMHIAELSFWYFSSLGRKFQTLVVQRSKNNEIAFVHNSKNLNKGRIAPGRFFGISLFNTRAVTVAVIELISGKVLRI